MKKVAALFVLLVAGSSAGCGFTVRFQQVPAPDVVQWQQQVTDTVNSLEQRVTQLEQKAEGR